MASVTKAKAKFPTIHKALQLSRHGARRLKSRANIKTKEQQKAFLNKAAQGCITMADIPKHPLFTPFYKYVRHIRYKILLTNPACKIFIYQNLLLIASDDGILVTVYKIIDKFKTIYDEIKTFNEAASSTQESLCKNLPPVTSE